MNSEFFVYVLRSVCNKHRYVGMTNNIDRRLNEHNSGKTRSIKAYRPWKMIYFEKYSTEAEAHKRELYFKSGVGREFLDRLNTDP